MYKNIKAQIAILIRQKGAKGCFLILLFCVICNYIRNIMIYQNIDRADVPNFLAISVLAQENKFGWYVLSFLAFLLVLPGGLSMAREKNSGVNLCLMSRCGGRLQYTISKILAVFFVTYFCFVVPFLIELVLDVCAFPIEASQSWVSVDIVYRKTEGLSQSFFLYELYQLHPIVYALVRIGMSGSIPALLSMVPLACSCVYCRYHVYLMIPVYLLLALFERTTFSVLGQKLSHDYFVYFWWGDAKVSGKQMLLFLLLNLLLAVGCAVFMLFHEARGEE